MATFFLALYSLFNRHRKIFWAGLVIVFAMLVLMASKISFEEDVTRFLPTEEKNPEAVRAAFAGNKLKDKVVVMVTSPVQDEAAMTAFADSFAARMESGLSREYISGVLHRVEQTRFFDLYEAMIDHLPLYLNDSDFNVIDSLTADSSIASRMIANYRSLLTPAGVVMGKFIEKDPLGFAPVILEKLKKLQLENNYHTNDGYIFSGDKKTLLVFISPAFDIGNTKKNDKFITTISNTIEELEKLSEGKIKASYFGAPAVSLANAQQIRKDSILSSSLSIVIILVLLLFFFRRKRVLLLILLPVIFGAVFALACMWLVKGTLSIIAIGGGSIILGLAINYSLHFFVHLKHVRDIKRVIRDLASPMTIGSITTVGAFLGLLFIKSEVLRDFGLFAAFSLIGSALFTLIALPHTAAFFSGYKFSPDGRLDHLIEKIVSFRFKRKLPLFTAIVLITGVLCWFAFDVSFEDDLMRMNYMPDDLARAEKQLDAINTAHLKSVYCITYGNSVGEAATANAKVQSRLQDLQKKNIVTHVSSVADFLLPDSVQQARITKWKNYWNPEKNKQVRNSIERQAALNGFASDAFRSFFILIEKDFRPINMMESRIFRNSLLSDFVSVKNNTVTILTGIKVSQEKREQLFEGFTGLPQVIIFDKLFLASQMMKVLQSDFSTVLYISSFLVFFFLLVSFGRIEIATFSFLPMLISWIWILGIMALLGIEFNIVNIIISTFIFGLGDDFSIFNSEGILQEYSSGTTTLPSFKTSILLSALTTFIGVGTLIFAKHPALSSVSLVTIIGLLCVVLISFYVQPLLYDFLVLERKKKGKVPLTFLTIFQSAFAFAYFLSGCLILSVIAIVVYPVIPLNKKYKKKVIHNLLSWFCASLVYVMFNVKKKIINEYKENFSKPAVVIANHQSFLDILLMIMVSNKTILLVKDWVWNSPFFGRVVRLAGFYPVERGFENSIPSLQEAVKMGYSIVVFPEGTRSETPDIRRFHKGAFYIAEKLHLDILPILIHGTSNTMSRTDTFLLKSGRLTLKILPRIQADDSAFGSGYYHRTKNISKYFKAEYARLREEMETPEYFKDRLIKNYIYKGPVLEWYIRIKLRLENNYKLFMDRVPRRGTIVDLGCGNGNVSLMLGFISKERIITGVDYDEDKIRLGANSPTKPANVNFVCSDVLQYDFSPADVFLLSDVLHYMPEKSQVELLNKCIAHLNPNGSVLIRDANADLEERHKGTKLTEFFSTSFGYNKAKHGGLQFISAGTIEQVARENGLQYEVIDNTKLTSNLFYHLRKVRRG